MKKSNNVIRNLIIVLFICVFSFMTIGFAMFSTTLTFNGSASLKPDGKFFISNVTKGTLTNAKANPEFTENSIDFNLSFTTVNSSTASYTAVFYVTFTNDSSYDFMYAAPDYTPRINNSSGKSIDSNYIAYNITGISIGDKIESHSTKTITVTFTFKLPEKKIETYYIDGDFEPNVGEDTTATLIGSVEGNSDGNLRGSNQYAQFSINVINTYNVPKNFTLYTEEPGIKLLGVGHSATPSYTIAANSEDEFTFYATKIDGAEFLSDTKRVNVIMLAEGGEPASAGRVTVLVDQNSFYEDTTPPTISNVSASVQNDNGTVRVSWTGTDDVLVDHYVVVVHDNLKNEIKRVTTANDNTYVDVTGLSAGTYTFVVAGVDSSNNTATANEIMNATTSSGHASRSTSTACKWVFTVTYNLTNANAPATTTVNRGATYTGTITKKNGYNLPSSATVTMGGQRADATYNSNTGAISVPNVTGDLVITATGSAEITCLLEGTKVLLASGEYKNIENIEYTDLLKVYDHVYGGFTYVYPLWIEKKSEVNKYEKITFSDGSILMTANAHSVYSSTLNKYVNVQDEFEFNIGTKVYKVCGDELYEVEVTSIEYIDEKVNVYDIMSTRYYNIIANDFITCDYKTTYINMYGFKDDLTYGDEYYLADTLKYDANLKGIPEYLFNGFHIHMDFEVMNDWLDIEFIRNYFGENTKLPMLEEGNLLFVVTNSLDEVSNDNINNYLFKEGDVYTFPMVTNVSYYEDTSNKEKYLPGDSYIVKNNTYFEAK